jgi:hypothetical protein
MDSDPRGPKTCGSGSPTLHLVIFFFNYMIFPKPHKGRASYYSFLRSIYVLYRFFPVTNMYRFQVNIMVSLLVPTTFSPVLCLTTRFFWPLRVILPKGERHEDPMHVFKYRYRYALH